MPEDWALLPIEILSLLLHLLIKNGETVVVVMNTSSEETKYNLWIEGKSLQVVSPANSIQTVVLSSFFTGAAS